ncbi:MAG: alpha/beta hydrolase [Limnothrix sp.]
MVCVVRNSRLKLSQGQIFWREAGQGEAVVFIHGECRNGSQWSDFFETLSRNYHCFAPDLMGFGDSEQPNCPYSIQWECEILEELFENLRLKKIYLVGDSLGAWVAARYALNHPERVAGLVLRSPLGVDTENNPRYFWEKRLTSRWPIVPWVLKLITPLAALFGQRKKIARAFEYCQLLRRSPGSCQLLFTRSGSQLRSEYLNYQLPQIQVPTLILSIDSDSAMQLSQTKTYGQLIKESTTKSVKNENQAIAAISDWLEHQ